MARGKMPAFAAILIFLCIAGCGGGRGASREEGEDSTSTGIADVTFDLARRADSLISTMTLEEKAAQVFLPALYASSDSYTCRRAAEYGEMGVGGIVLLKGDTEGARLVGDSMRLNSAVAPFVAIDAEWGLAMRLADAPRFPANGRIDRRADDEVMYDYGREMARECRAIGVNMVLGPVVDVAEGGFIGVRSFGGDPERVGELALAYARGLEDGDVLSVAKHFPGHGAAAEDSHSHKGVVKASLDSLEGRDLIPFRRWVEVGLSGIMVGHLAVPAIDPAMNPAAVSRPIVEGLLREDMGFRGLVLTDALNMGGAEGGRPSEALNAGADMIVAPADTKGGIAEVVASVERGDLPEWRLDEAVGRILRYKYIFGGIHDEAIGDTLFTAGAAEISRRLEGPGGK